MRVRHETLRVAQKLFRPLGLDVTRRHFYSPIPPTSLPDSTWERKRTLPGIHFDLDEQMQWVANCVVPYAGEFRPPIMIGGYLFEYSNRSFGHGDADVLYSVVRSRRPARIVELGSGNSSVVIRLALERNRLEGDECAYEVYDPYPNDLLASTDMAVQAVPLPAESVPATAFTQLNDGDILFVDTTHTVRIGGDVVAIILDSLPLLKPGVLVHFHDIPMPYEYAEQLVQDGFYWAEQYLLQAFLAYNSSFEVVAGLRALSLDRREAFAKVTPSIVDGAPASLWITRVR